MFFLLAFQQNFHFLGRSIIANRKENGSQVKESTDSSTTLEDDEIKGTNIKSLIVYTLKVIVAIKPKCIRTTWKYQPRLILTSYSHYEANKSIIHCNLTKHAQYYNKAPNTKMQRFNIGFKVCSNLKCSASHQHFQQMIIIQY